MSIRLLSSLAVLGWGILIPSAMADRAVFDPVRGAEEAGVIVVARVEEAWPRRADGKVGGMHRIMRLRVLDAWKGGAKAGDDLFLVDTGWMSSVQLAIDERRPVLLYLMPADTLSGAGPAPDYDAGRDERWRRWRAAYDTPAGALSAKDGLLYTSDRQVAPSERALPAMATRPLYVSRREAQPAKDGDAWRADPALADEIGMLDAVFRPLAAPADADPDDRWWTVLDAADNPYLLEYALARLPRALAEADVARLFRVVDRLPGGHGALDRIQFTITMNAARRDEQAAWPADVFARLWARSDDAQRRALINGRILALTPETVAPVRGDLRRYVLENGSTTLNALRALAHHAPAEARDLFREHRTEIPPLWALFLCKRLKGNADAFGWPPFSDALLAVDDGTLYWALVAGAGDSTLSPLSTDAPEQKDAAGWRRLAPLFARPLAAPDGPGRRKLAALLRSMGATVERAGDGYAVRAGGGDSAAAPPVVVRIEPVADPVKAGTAVTVAWTRAVARPTTLGRAQTSWFVVASASGDGAMSQGMGRFGLDFAMQKDRDGRAVYAEWAPEQVERQEQAFDPRWFAKAGVYRVWMAQTYADDGLEAGRDAWTGLVVSPPIEVTVTP